MLLSILYNPIERFFYLYNSFLQKKEKAGSVNFQLKTEPKFPNTLDRISLDILDRVFYILFIFTRVIIERHLIERLLISG